MSLGSFQQSPHQRPMAEINTTPLVDVMLVLFVIVLVTAPVLTHTVSLDLPKEASQLTADTKVAHTLSIDAVGDIYWGSKQVSREQLLGHFKQAANEDKDQPIELYIDKAAPYGSFSWVLLEAQNTGLTKVGFVLELDR